MENKLDITAGQTSGVTSGKGTEPGKGPEPPHEERSKAPDGPDREPPFMQLVRILVHWACVIGFRIRHFGTENVPETGGLILASNHQCFLDPFLVGLGVKRPLHYMARASAFNNPFLGPFIRALNAFPVTRGHADHVALKAAIEVVTKGGGLVLFPEGTRTHDGTIGTFKPGIVTIAQRGGGVIVPVAIRGAFEAYPRQARLPRPGVISVAYGCPLEPGKGKDDARKVTADLERQVRNLFDELSWRHERH